MRLLFALLLLSISGCADLASQKDSRGLAPLEAGGRVALVSNVKGTFSDVVSASLYFYPGKFEIPLKHLDDKVWRGDISPEQVKGMARQPYGFRVYRARLTVVSRGPSGEKASREQDLTIVLDPS
jgi:hypothetical protein